MFDQAIGSLTTEVDALTSQIHHLAAIPATAATLTELGPLLVRLETATDQLAGINARLLAAFDTAGGPEEHGAPSLNVWTRRELRITPTETLRRSRRAAALDALPDTQAALAAGVIGVSHLDAIAHGVHQMGADVIAAVEPVLLDVAATCDANTVRETVRKVRDTLDPDAGLAAYLRALDRRDITIVAVGEGFAISGFLDPETGVKFKEVLYSLGKKTSVDDDRTPGQRRVDGLGDLCTSVLNHGLPSDRGQRPHLTVTVPAERLEAATQGKPAAGEPAVLTGHGHICDQLLTKLACDTDYTPILTGDNNQTLDVGRTSRLASKQQRRAVLAQQQGVCFNPGCSRTEHNNATAP